jgi:hypothetical protein
LHKTLGVFKPQEQQKRPSLQMYPSPVFKPAAIGVVPSFKQNSSSMHKHSCLPEQPMQAGTSVYKAPKQQPRAETKIKLSVEISAIFYNKKKKRNG